METNDLSNNSLKGTRKVQYAYYGNKRYPVLHFGGLYLRRFNFEVGDVVEVSIENDRIIIQKMQSEMSE